MYGLRSRVSVLTRVVVVTGSDDGRKRLENSDIGIRDNSWELSGTSVMFGRRQDRWYLVR